MFFVSFLFFWDPLWEYIPVTLADLYTRVHYSKSAGDDDDDVNDDDDEEACSPLASSADARVARTIKSSA